jgi:pimeloyl-ACP methyl ester carboxylesterase
MAIDYEMHRSYVEIDGAVISYLDIGSGEAVMLAHGYLWSAMIWEPQIKALSRRYRLIIPDLSGHGRSDEMPWKTADLAIPPSFPS